MLTWRVFSSEMSRDAPARDRTALVAGLYDRYGRGLCRYAAMLLADVADAEDVVQQVFAAMMTAGQVREPEAFLRTAVRNASLSRLRQRRAARTASDHFLEPAAPECTLEERVALEAALRALPIEQREVVHLHVYEGMTFREVADTTGESINTVAARYRYALNKLRKLIR